MLARAARPNGTAMLQRYVNAGLLGRGVQVDGAFGGASWFDFEGGFSGVGRYVFKLRVVGLIDGLLFEIG